MKRVVEIIHPVASLSVFRRGQVGECRGELAVPG